MLVGEAELFVAGSSFAPYAVDRPATKVDGSPVGFRTSLANK